MHEPKTNKPGRTSTILIISLLVLTFSSFVLSRWVVPNVIQRAYYGQSLQVFNHLITGQTSHSVTEYLASWNKFARNATLVLVVGGLLLVLIIRPEFQDFFWGPDPPARDDIRTASSGPQTAFAGRALGQDFPSRSISKSELLILFGLLLCGALLRLAFLGSKSFFEDEVFSVFLARQHWPTFFGYLLSGEANMALYYFLLHFWIHLGHSEFVVRTLSVVFGVATIPVMLALGKQLFDQKIAALATLLFTINGFHILYSQMARSYSLLVLLASLSSLYFIRSAQQPFRTNWTRYIVATILAAYCHFFAALLPLSHWAALALSKQKQKMPWRRMFASSATIGLFLLPLAAFILNRNRGQLDWIPPFHPDLVLTMFSDFATNSRVLPFDLGRVLLLCILLIPAGISAIGQKSQVRSDELWFLRFLFAWLLIPVAIVAAASLHKPIFRPNYLIFCLPAFLLLAAYSLCRMPWRWLAALTLALIVISTGRGLAVYYREPGLQDWRATTRYVLANARPGDAFVFYPPHLALSFEYYQERFGPIIPQPVLLKIPSEEEFQSFAAGLSAHNDRVWLIGRNETAEKRADERRSLEASLGAEFPLRTDQRFRGTIAILFSRQNFASVSNPRDDRFRSTLRLKSRADRRVFIPVSSALQAQPRACVLAPSRSLGF